MTSGLNSLTAHSPNGPSLADSPNQGSPRPEMFRRIAASSTFTLKPSPRSSLTYTAGISSPSLVSEPSYDTSDDDDDLLLLTPSELHIPSESRTCDDSRSTTAVILPRKRSIDNDINWSDSLSFPRNPHTNDSTQGHKRSRGDNVFVLKMRRRRVESDLFREVTGSTITWEPTAPCNDSIPAFPVDSSQVLVTPRQKATCFFYSPPAVQRAVDEELPSPRCHSGILLPFLS